MCTFHLIEFLGLRLTSLRSVHRQSSQDAIVPLTSVTRSQPKNEHKVVVQDMNTLQQAGSHLGAEVNGRAQIRSFISGDNRTDQGDIMIAGSLAIDLSCNFTPIQGRQTSAMAQPQLHTSNPAKITSSLGGVGYNITRAAGLLHSSVSLCSVVADDVSGRAALETLQNLSLRRDEVKIVKAGTIHKTAQYVAFNEKNKNLIMAMADMEILENAASQFIAEWASKLKVIRPKWLVVDANWDPLTLRQLIMAGKAAGANVIFEPVSAAKATRLFQCVSDASLSFSIFPTHQISIATPNAMELTAMYTTARDGELFDGLDWWQIINSCGISSSGARDLMMAITNQELVDQGIPQQSIQLLPFIPCILTTLGSRGVLATRLLPHDDPSLLAPATDPYIISRNFDRKSPVGGIHMRLYPPAEVVADSDIVSVNGAGDTFVGTLVAGLAKSQQIDFDRLIDVAQKASVMTLQSGETVHPGLGQLRNILMARASDTCVM